MGRWTEVSLSWETRAEKSMRVVPPSKTAPGQCSSKQGCCYHKHWHLAQMGPTEACYLPAGSKQGSFFLMLSASWQPAVLL